MASREQMNAIVVERYGGVEQLVHKRIDKPSVSDGHDVLVKWVCRSLYRASEDACEKQEQKKKTCADGLDTESRHAVSTQ